MTHVNPHRPAELTRDELIARRAQPGPRSVEETDVRMAAAELGVTPQLLVNVLDRRSLHLGTDPAGLRQLDVDRETLQVAAHALRRRAKVHSLDEGIQAGLQKLATFLDREALR